MDIIPPEHWELGAVGKALLHLKAKQCQERLSIIKWYKEDCLKQKRSMEMNTGTGTVSHGTMRPEDLIPVFLDELSQRDYDQYIVLCDDYDLRNGGEIDYNHEDALWLLSDLFDALDNVAPDGYYFGAHVGDGSDYGYWRIENE